MPAKAKTRAQAVQDLLPALKLKGNAAAGKVLYTQRCALCHRAGKDGHALGPDLLSVKANGPEKLLVSIVDPNREVAANYVAYDLALRDGSTQTGLLGDETLTHVRIRLPLGKEVPISGPLGKEVHERPCFSIWLATAQGKPDRNESDTQQPSSLTRCLLPTPLVRDSRKPSMSS